MNRFWPVNVAVVVCRGMCRVVGAVLGLVWNSRVAVVARRFRRGLAAASVTFFELFGKSCDTGGFSLPVTTSVVTTAFDRLRWKYL